MMESGSVGSGTEVTLYGADGGVALTEHARITVTGLELAGEVTEDELRRIGSGFNLLESAKSFAVGDLANFYREHFPREYRDWLGSAFSELDQKTLKVYAAVCKAFPDHDYRARFVLRYEGRRALSFSHFSEVRKYSPTHREHFLERAATEDLSLEQMREMIEEEGDLTGVDEVPIMPEVDPTCVKGYIYTLGPHRLLCGDCTDPALMAALLGSERADMVWTDPPYGVDYVGKTGDQLVRDELGAVVGKTEGALTIQHDTGEGLEEILIGAWRAAIPVCKESAPVYCAGPSGDRGEIFLRSFRLAGLQIKQWLVWRKNRMIMGRSDYHYQHEPIFYAQMPGPKMGRTAGGSLNWYGGDNSVSIFEAASPSASREHPTMKPVKLIVPAITNSSQEGEIVLDPFAGSGSTLIAADMTGRRAYLVELDEHYADVIVARWQRWEAEKLARGIGEALEAEASETSSLGPTVFEE